MSKILVSYISFSGVTKRVAEKINEIIKGNLVEIKPVIPYTDDDLNWNDTSSRSSIEMQDINARPEIKDIENISDYDTIFIGYPIWWGTYPREINTFIDRYDMSGKTIIPFCTSGGTDIGESISDLEKALPNSKVIHGKKLSINDVESFVKSLEL